MDEPFFALGINKFFSCFILLDSVTGSIVHAFLWLALWLLLTSKTNWDFRLKISIGRTLLRSPSCLALAAQVEFKSDNKGHPEVSSFSPPLRPNVLLNGVCLLGI